MQTDVDNPSDDADKHAPPQRSSFPKRFGLGTLLIVFSIVCVVAGKFASERYRDYKETQAIEAISGAGGITRRKNGAVYRVHLQGAKFDDAQFHTLVPHLTYIRGLEELDFVKSPITDQGLAEVSKLRGLRELYLFETNVTDAGREALKQEHPQLAIKLTAPDPIAVGLSASKIYGHAINSIALRPNRKNLVAGNGDGELLWWQDSLSHSTTAAHSEWLFATAFSHDGRWLATGGGDGIIRLWNSESQDPIGSVHLHADDVHAVEFSPDDKMLFSVSDDMTIRRTPTADSLAASPTTSGTITLGQHEETIPCIAVDPSGRIVASGSRDNTIALWDAENGGLIKKLVGHSDDVMSIVFSDNGKSLFSASYDGTVRRWDVATGETTLTLRGHKKRAYAVAVNPDNTTLASGGADGIVIWDLETATKRRRLARLKNVSALAFDGQQLVAADAMGTVRFINSTSGKLEKRLETSRARLAYQ